MIQFSIINCIWSYSSLHSLELKRPSFPAGAERNWSRRPVRHSPAPCVAPSGRRATERRLRGSARRRTSRARPKIAMERVGRSTDGMSQELETAGKNGKNQTLERCRTLPNPQITAIKRSRNIWNFTISSTMFVSPVGNARSNCQEWKQLECCRVSYTFSHSSLHMCLSKTLKKIAA